MSDLPTDIEVGDTYAVRTFAVKNGRLTSIAQHGSQWMDGRCLAICTLKPDEPDHIAPVDSCSCGVYAWWTPEQLIGQYKDHAKFIIAVIRMEGLCLEGETGVRTNAAEIVAWWVADCDEPDGVTTAMLAAACEASAPGTRRFFDRDVMIGLYPTGRNSNG